MDGCKFRICMYGKRTKLFFLEELPMRVSVIYSYLLMVATTAVYCLLVWYGGNLTVLFSPWGGQSPPLFTQLCIVPLPLPVLWNMIHWQTPAVLSLVVCISWGVRKAKRTDGDAELALPMVVHTGWIVFAICCNLLGGIMSMLEIGHVLK